MIPIVKQLYLAAPTDLYHADPERAVVVNLSHKLHYELHDWQQTENHKEDEEYIIAKRDNILSVNWVDANDPSYYNYQNHGLSVVRDILEFMHAHYKQEKDILVICDKNISRSPTVAMTFMAKRLELLRNNFFKDAVKTFQEKYYKNYQPAQGIYQFFDSIWDVI